MNINAREMHLQKTEKIYGYLITKFDLQNKKKRI